MFIEISKENLRELSKHVPNNIMLERQIILMSTTVISDSGTVIKNRAGNQTDVTVEMAQLMRRIREII